MHTSTLLIVAAAVIAVVLPFAGVMVRLLGRQQRPQSSAISYEAVPALLTPAERSFYGVLQQAVASEYQIFVKVRLADIVRPIRGQSRSAWQLAFNRITGKHVDFVLCDLARLSVIAAVELDDRSHKSFERGVRDVLVDSALTEAHIPILRVTAAQCYSPTQVREKIQDLFRPPEKIVDAVA